MATVQRFLRIDMGGEELAPPQQLANGSWVVEGWATRAGVFRYLNPDGTERFEYRSPEEVAKAATNLPLRAMTNNHPPPAVGRVTPANASTYQQGVVLEAKWVEEKQRIWVRCLLTHADLIRAVKAGKKELSCGYECDVIEKKGDHEGQAYTHEQVGIEHNHLAVVDRGRAGPECALHLDAEGNVVAPSTQPAPVPGDAGPVDNPSQRPSNEGRNTPPNPAPPAGDKENPTVELVEVYINGIQFKLPKEVANAIAQERAANDVKRAQEEQKVTALATQAQTAEAAAATATAEADAAKAKTELAQNEAATAKADAARAKADAEAARAEATSLKARADSAEAQLKNEQKLRADAEDPAVQQKRLDTRMTLVRATEGLLGKNYKFDGQSNHQVRLDALTSLLKGETYKDLRADVEANRDNEVYIEGIYRSQMAYFQRNGGRLDQDAPLRSGPGSGGGTGAKTTAQWEDHSRNAYLGTPASQPTPPAGR